MTDWSNQSLASGYFFLLQEIGFYLLQENGFRLELQESIDWKTPTKNSAI